MHECHNDVEPLVEAASLREVLGRYGLKHRTTADRRESPDDSVAIVAERAETSARTVYRVIDPQRLEPVSIDLADRLLIAVGALGELNDLAMTCPGEA